MLTVAHLSICEDDGGVHQFREQDAIESSRVRVQPAQVTHFGPYFLHDQVAVLCSNFQHTQGCPSQQSRQMAGTVWAACQKRSLSIS